MKKQTKIFAFVALAVVLIAVISLMYVREATAQGNALDPSAITLPDRFEYAAKFVCGFTQTSAVPPSEPAVKPGNYATSINIHNPWNNRVTIQKKVAVSAPERFPQTQLIPPTKRFEDTLKPDHAMSVDCSEIVNLLGLNGTPPTGAFIEGYLVIDSYFSTATTAGAADLDVQAVYTTAATSGISSGATVNSIEVKDVNGRKLPAGTWPF